MTAFNNLRIAMRLSLGFGLVLVLLLMMAIVGVQQARSINAYAEYSTNLRRMSRSSLTLRIGRSWSRLKKVRLRTLPHKTKCLLLQLRLWPIRTRPRKLGD
ncbi:hypothetical protein [Roseateles puraquae]|jgi:hypothetical protein|uniref:Chemotaxis methyl-accepting receptor HlyB-like 4HB MCP domain-containing protein n=1 Tax=Roseateles puraquae TaxID=431059 RepID=A0A254N7P1_9BURK|nr:hypothetical protein [Roseateles puraquae]MDG0852166.1 hypothetical protein [Roseateles puraquae]OWR04036.1 hypothetical protein CDO81_09935 [Roseateles puraquae]